MHVYIYKISQLFSSIVRLQKIKDAFHQKYGETPFFYAYAPGRVNLIGEFINAPNTIIYFIFFICLFMFSGEHIDYCGYAVLPMAIEQNILAAVSLNDTQTIQLANIDPKYK